MRRLLLFLACLLPMSVLAAPSPPSPHRPDVPHPPPMPGMPRLPGNQQEVLVEVNGSAVQFDVQPLVEAGFVFVPLRGVFEKMKATVGFDAATKRVTARRGATVVELKIGEKLAHVNGQSMFMLQPAKYRGGRMLVPLRFLSEALGAEVEWDPGHRTVSITAQ